ncbi:MAG: bifunctional precorrin-2 dehydrogenase/sirohydrochlorin ferrochelatase [Bacteroidota bacterium]
MAANPLYPVFLKLHQLRLLIVGAGEVGFEKLSFILKSSPDAQITVVAPEVSPAIRQLLAERSHHVTIQSKSFAPSDIDGHDLVIAATNIRELNAQIQQAAKAKGRLVNVADTPALCDFYLGSIVTRGPLKIAISTNGQSPTFAKRFRQVLEEVLPHDVADLLDNLRAIRDRLRGNFSYKVKKLNEVTASLLEEKEKPVDPIQLDQ